MMLIVGVFFVAALAVFGASIAFQLHRKNIRKARLSGLELRPNCLLTRYPIVFIASPRSIFRLFEHWNDIPIYLREHGYEVVVIEPFGKVPRFTQISNALKDLDQPFHLIADSSSRIELEAIARENLNNAVSLTQVQSARNKQIVASPVTAHDLKPMGQAIEIFALPATDFEFSVASLAALALLTAHNLFFLGRDRAIDFLEIAELDGKLPFEIESRFLDLAVTLAERDVQWSTDG